MNRRKFYNLSGGKMSMVTLVLKLVSPEIILYVRSSKSNSVLIWREKISLNNKQQKIIRVTNSDTLIMMSRCLQRCGLTQVLKP